MENEIGATIIMVLFGFVFLIAFCAMVGKILNPYGEDPSHQPGYTPPNNSQNVQSTQKDFSTETED